MKSREFIFKMMETMDEPPTMSQDIASFEEYYWENYETYIKPYVEQRFARVSWVHQYGTFENNNYYPGFMYRHLFFTFVIIEDSRLSDEEKLIEFIQEISFGKSKIVTVVGARDSGKTASAMKFVEEVKKTGGHGSIYYVGRPANIEAYPDWIKFVDNLNELPNNCIAMIDEAGMKYNARKYQTEENMQLTDKLVILRHDGISIIIMTQHLKLVDINLRRLSDILVFKKGSEYGIERKKGESMPQEEQERMIIRKRLKPKNKRACMVEYLNASVYPPFRSFEVGLPTFWDDEKISKSFKGYKKEVKDTNIKKPKKVIQI